VEEKTKDDGDFEIVNHPDKMADTAQDESVCAIVITAVRNDAGKKGLQRGDVITHVNGKAFHGSSMDLHMLLQGLSAASDSETLELTVNAEPCIAQALKWRALATF